MQRISHPEQLAEWKEDILSKRPASVKTLVISSGTCGQASGSGEIVEQVKKELARRDLEDSVVV
ncbi:MAG: hypothetical protein ACE5LV_08755, partial [Candidatus Aminicenantales bacterium]